MAGNTFSNNLGNLNIYSDNNVRNTRIWNSANVDICRKQILDGAKLKETPFYKNNCDLRCGDIVFEYSQEEMSELTRCANDIIYFAERYPEVMTDFGITKIKVRPYQRAILYNYAMNRFNILLSSRQVGKCVLFNTIIRIKKGVNGVPQNICIGELYYKIKKRLYGLTFLENIKLFLWKTYASI